MDKINEIKTIIRQAHDRIETYEKEDLEKVLYEIYIELDTFDRQLN